MSRHFLAPVCSHTVLPTKKEWPKLSFTSDLTHIDWVLRANLLSAFSICLFSLPNLILSFMLSSRGDWMIFPTFLNNEERTPGCQLRCPDGKHPGSPPMPLAHTLLLHWWGVLPLFSSSYQTEYWGSNPQREHSIWGHSGQGWLNLCIWDGQESDPWGISLSLMYRLQILSLFSKNFPEKCSVRSYEGLWGSTGILSVFPRKLFWQGRSVW